MVCEVMADELANCNTSFVEEEFRDDFMHTTLIHDSQTANATLTPDNIYYSLMPTFSLCSIFLE